jgi:hypothetical protein
MNIFKCLEFKLLEMLRPFLCYIVFCCIGIDISSSTQKASWKSSAKFITVQLILNLKVVGPDWWTLGRFTCIPCAKVTKLKDRPVVKIVSVRLSASIFYSKLLNFYKFWYWLSQWNIVVFNRIGLIYLPPLNYVKLKLIFIDFIKKANRKNLCAWHELSLINHLSIRSKSLWQWYINTSIMFLDFVHRLVRD